MNLASWQIRLVLASQISCQCTKSRITLGSKFCELSSALLKAHTRLVHSVGNLANILLAGVAANATAAATVAITVR